MRDEVNLARKRRNRIYGCLRWCSFRIRTKSAVSMFGTRENPCKTRRDSGTGVRPFRDYDGPDTIGTCESVRHEAPSKHGHLEVMRRLRRGSSRKNMNRLLTFASHRIRL